MAAESTAHSELNIGHILFIDIVGYSKMLTSEQREQQQELNRTVRETEQFRASRSGRQAGARSAKQEKISGRHTCRPTMTPPFSFRSVKGNQFLW